jgi:hypothetical protein
MEKKLDLLMCTCHPSYGVKHKIRDEQSRLSWAKRKTLSLKQPEEKVLEDVSSSRASD